MILREEKRWEYAAAKQIIISLSSEYLAENFGGALFKHSYI